MRTLVMGDQHGHLEKVRQVLTRCEFDPDTDRLINLGDIVDRGPHSAQLIEFWIELNKMCASPIIFIRGNHDDWFLDYFKQKGSSSWINQGGKETLLSYTYGSYNTDEHFAFLRGQKPYFIDEENRAFVHGGFVSHRGLGHDPFESNYWWDRTLWETAVVSNPSLPRDYMSKRLDKHKEIFVGHTPTVFYSDKSGKPITVPMNALNVWNVDTGSYMGKISILDVNTKQYWQSD